MRTSFNFRAIFALIAGLSGAENFERTKSENDRNVIMQFTVNWFNAKALN